MPSSEMLLFASFPIPRQTQTAGTAIVSLVPGRKGRKTILTKLRYTSGGTAHTLTVLKEKARCKLAVAAAGAATSLIVDRDPGKYSTDPTMGGAGTYAAGVPLGRGITPSTADNAIAANDYIAFELADGTPAFAKVTAVATDSATGRVTLTVAAISAAGANVGAQVWFFGVAGDTDPQTNAVDQALKPTVSTATDFPNTSAVGTEPVEISRRMFSPLLVYSDNITAAGTLEEGSASYAAAG